MANRLISEASPYLRQHAGNPVDWWPWGDDALAEAARREVPVFLSAGYATCHWCHVMERESFENNEIAQFLNQNFVAVKLDREQRPDIDQIYLTATMLQHRHAGWPNSVWLLPDGKPFHTGTYFPPDQFLLTLRAVAKAWRDSRAELVDYAGALATQIRQTGRHSPPPASLAGAPAAATAMVLAQFNRRQGGFSGGTQFPNEGHILFLLDHWRRDGEALALAAARRTLDAIVAGGLHDQVGGGFHRYAVDVGWRAPHFEKMLYNQGLLIQCFTQAWQITGKADYLRAVERAVEYLRRDMMLEDGTFASAEDADSADASGTLHEGAFYLWRAAELPDPGRAALFGLDPGAAEGDTIHFDIDRTGYAAFDAALNELRLARDARTRPFRDDKVIGGWNGLAIRALAQAGLAADRRDWIEMADTALDSLLGRLQSGHGLARLSAQGQSLEAANLTDHAWIALAALALADAGQTHWLARAAEMADRILDEFATDDGRLALVPGGTPLGAVLENEDGATPAGKSSALELLALLGHRLPDLGRQARLLALRDALSGRIAEMPVARLTALAATRAIDAESGSLLVLAQGKLRLHLVRSATGMALDITIAPGWHIPASSLIVTGATTDLPPPQAITETAALETAAHSGGFRLGLSHMTTRLDVTCLICSDQVCLAPVQATFRTLT